MRPTPLQNRAAPDGSLHAVAARGTLMGNRGGRLHREDGTLGAARWRSRAWICCRLAFRDRHRVVMGAGYTEIFFLDEATALAAGHRPCFECRRADARAFAALWPGGRRARPGDGPDPPCRAAGPAADGRLRRAAPGYDLRGRRRLLPARRPAAPAWSFGGYRAARQFAAHERVAALTPPTIRAILAAGYAPALHPSAGAS